MTDTKPGFARLREPFGPEHIGRLPKALKKDSPKGKCLPKREGGEAPAWQDYFCGGYHGLPAIHLEYAGHAAITDRLLEVDPAWTWEPLAFDDNGLPRFVCTSNGQPTRLWIKLTVLGVTRIGVGSVDVGAFDAEKQLIGDALRNAAMRFGVALDLWIKGEKHDEPDTERQEPTPPAPPPADAEKLSELEHHIGGLTDEQKAALKQQWRDAGLPSVAHLSDEQVTRVWLLVGAVEHPQPAEAEPVPAA